MRFSRWLTLINVPSRTALGLVAGLVILRLLVGFWVLHAQGGFLIDGLADVDHRLSLVGFWDNTRYIPSESCLPVCIAVGATVERLVHDLLLAPALTGSLAVAVWILAMFALSYELFPRTPEAGVVTVLLVAFSPILTVASLTSDAIPLTLAFTATCLWTYFAWRRTLLPLALLASAAAFALACWTSLDAWLLLGPFWLFATVDGLRNAPERKIPRVAAALVFGSGLLAAGAWLVFARLRPDVPDPLDVWFGPLPEERALGFEALLSALGAGVPLLLLGLPIGLVSTQVRERDGVPLARLLACSALLVLYSVYQRPDGLQGPRRLFSALVLFAPFLGGGTVAAIRAVSSRPARALALVWLLILVSMAFGISQSLSHRQEYGAIVEMGVALDRELSDEFAEGGNVLFESSVTWDPEATRDQKAIAPRVLMAQLCNPAHIHMDAVLSRGGVPDEDFEAMVRKTTKRYKSRKYLVIVALGPTTVRLFEACGYRKVGTRGPFQFLADENEPEVAQATQRLVQGLRAPLPEEIEKPAPRAGERPERPARERPERPERVKPAPQQQQKKKGG